MRPRASHRLFDEDGLRSEQAQALLLRRPRLQRQELSWAEAVRQRQPLEQAPQAALQQP